MFNVKSHVYETVSFKGLVLSLSAQILMLI